MKKNKFLKFIAGTVFVTAPVYLAVAAVAVAPVVGISAVFCGIVGGLLGLCIASGPALIGMLSFDANDRSYGGTAVKIVEGLPSAPGNILRGLSKKAGFNAKAKKPVPNAAPQPPAPKADQPKP